MELLEGRVVLRRQMLYPPELRAHTPRIQFILAGRGLLLPGNRQPAARDEVG
jgi:hypothetical protein